MTKPKDDLEAVRDVVAALQDFEPADAERILRWAREKLGLSAPVRGDASLAATPFATPATKMPDTVHGQDIKSFIAAKHPKSDMQFAATVAYYYKFEAPVDQRKEFIMGDDLQEACRQTGRKRFTNPNQTLVNAHHTGYLDKAGDRGAYQINTVGENLVAMALPETGAAASAKRSTQGGRKKAKRKPKKK